MLLTIEEVKKQCPEFAKGKSDSELLIQMAQLELLAEMCMDQAKKECDRIGVKAFKKKYSSKRHDQTKAKT